MIRADLHTHTYYSDGGQSPKDIITAAKGRGVGLISITDHDSSEGCEEGANLAKEAGISFVDGVEVSAYEGEIKVHMLCYGMDYSSPEYIAFARKRIEGAEERTFDILKKLSAVGVNVEYGEVLRERKSKNSPIHGMHIAKAGARKGYASSPVDFFIKYLNHGRAAFSCICRPTPIETAEMCVRCSGFCSLAHPGRISADEEWVNKLILNLKGYGLEGIEAVYSGHTDRQTQYYKGLAESFSLLVTGGSDTHYREGNRRIGDPCFYPSDELLSALKIKC
ncbi:MAG: PHP domain-containing protein [Candidatus Coproplasma sp.]